MPDIVVEVSNVDGAHRNRTDNPHGVSQEQIGRKVTTITSATTLSFGTHDVVIADTSSGSFNITLPSPSDSDEQALTIRCTGSNGCTVDTSGSAQIDNSDTFDLTQDESITVVNDNTDYWVI